MSSIDILKIKTLWSKKFEEKKFLNVIVAIHELQFKNIINVTSTRTMLE
jgi:hypothetical protein